MLSSRLALPQTGTERPVSVCDGLPQQSPGAAGTPRASTVNPGLEGSVEGPQREICGSFTCSVLSKVRGLQFVVRKTLWQPGF